MRAQGIRRSLSCMRMTIAECSLRQVANRLFQREDLLETIPSFHRPQNCLRSRLACHALRTLQEHFQCRVCWSGSSRSVVPSPISRRLPQRGDRHGRLHSQLCQLLQHRECLRLASEIFLCRRALRVAQHFPRGPSKDCPAQ